MFGLVPFGGSRYPKNTSDGFRRLFELINEPFADFDFQKLDGFGHDIKVDVKETDSAYEIHADLPGASKENIDLKYEDDYLTIAVRNEENKDEKDDEGKYIRRERRSSYSSRSFYVTDIRKDDIKAEFKDGILKINLPKREAKEEKVDNTIKVE